MELPDGTTLMHGPRAYDPKKAHEYYLRTRKLKGRKKGHVDPHVAGLAKKLAGMSDAEIHNEIKKAEPKDAKLMQVMLGNRQRIHGKKDSPKTSATLEQKQAAAKRVASLRSELADLNTKLKKAMAKSRKSQAKKKRGPTASEKSKAARDSKKYRDKHKQKLASKRGSGSSKSKTSGKHRDDSVTSLKKQISETKGRLAKAIERQKALG